MSRKKRDSRDFANGARESIRIDVCRCAVEALLESDLLARYMYAWRNNRL
jgi:hypothetical protein